MKYTLRKMLEARARLQRQRERPRHCTHPNMEYGGIGMWFVDYCPDCGENFYS